MHTHAHAPVIFRHIMHCRYKFIHACTIHAIYMQHACTIHAAAVLDINSSICNCSCSTSCAYSIVLDMQLWYSASYQYVVYAMRETCCRFTVIISFSLVITFVVIVFNMVGFGCFWSSQHTFQHMDSSKNTRNIKKVHKEVTNRFGRFFLQVTYTWRKSVQ